MVAEARCGGASLVLFLSPAGDRDDRRASGPWLLAQGVAHVVAVDERHADVEQDDVGTQRRRSVERA